MAVTMDFLKRKVPETMKRMIKKNGTLDSIDHLPAEKAGKNIQQSQKARAEGDKLFAEDNRETEHHHKIIRSYNESIAYAPLGSEDLAKSYANKSALLRRMRRYSECISEADKALKISQSIPMKIKLLCRKAECHTALDSSENRGCLEKAKFLMTRADMNQESEKMQKMLQKLIAKTQKIVDETKLDTPKELKRFSQTVKLIANAQKNEVRLNSITTAYCEKYGPHFVAARDLEPGELIMLEKPYHFQVPYAGMYQYCYYCLNYLWTAVPCDRCNWRTYCSEKCKNNSWNEYHDLECFISTCIKGQAGFIGCGSIFILSIFCKTLKEAGSISQLLADVGSIDQKGGPWIEDFPTNGSFNHKSVYALPLIANFDELRVQVACETAIALLVSLGKYTKIFDESHNFYDPKKLMKDDIVISIGALLMKLIVVSSESPSHLQLHDPTKEWDPWPKDMPVGSGPIGAKSDGMKFDLSHFMTSVGCIPNIEIGFTREYWCIMHSLQPIKKGDKLISFSRIVSIFNYIPKAVRQSRYREYFHCSCECRACAEDWSEVDLKKGLIESKIENEAIWKGLVDECNFYITERRSLSRKYYNPDIKTLSKARDFLRRAWQHCEMPSTIIIRAVRTFSEVAGYFYGPSIPDWK